MNEVTAKYMAYVLYALILVHIRTTMALVAMVIFQSRQQQRTLIECAMNTTYAFSIRLSKSSRNCWMRVRSKDWWERVVLTEFSDSEWRETFRMSRASFDKLCGLMEGVLSPEDKTVRAPIPLQMRVAIVLYKLAGSAEYRLVASQFGVHKSTVKKFVYCFCKGMTSSVIHSLIKVPTVEEAIDIARRFEQKFNIPQILGCIDGTHVPVLPPSDGYKDFLNRNGWPSYVLQAVVDDMYRFWNINCKMPGRAHDANVLRQSALFAQAHQLPKEPREINRIPVNLFLLGDPAYPLMDWLMKDYIRSPNITPEQESFNVYLSSARTTVEIAFGRLKSRWRVLLKRSDFHYTFTPHVVATCCALHNFCEREKETVTPAWLDEAAILEHDLPQPGMRSYHATDCAGGQNVRLALTEYLKLNFPLRR
ncbi:uncharacterized protein si:ch211-121a2.4 isoform X1 [Dunckerocampus dactyliophorus]|uniref:uncharacterized protein si:ch211-121a2.4 isoform X1 n=1 Tax=Dunckerocampus dactyliophorus TaxID=161453 RepID=UPI00240617A9|nr:uncharacterized protein si:ch211-121a2.4 isoform X1 [Dunckerocampus dactyliophorus]